MARERFNTTKKDFEKFQKHFMDAIAAYKLGNWTITFNHKYLKNNRAEVVPDLEEETAEVILSTNWKAVKEDDEDEFIEYVVTALNIKKTAWHEARHLLFQPLVTMLGRYNADDGEVGHLEHVMIAKMEHADYYKPKRGKGK